MFAEKERLYVLVRADLKPGLQAAQACLALQAFNKAHWGIVDYWHRTSNNIIVLGVSSENELKTILQLAKIRKIASATFHEPDLDGQLTAVALDGDAQDMLSHLPLALRGEPLRRTKPRSNWLRGAAHRLGAWLLYR